MKPLRSFVTAGPSHLPVERNQFQEALSVPTETGAAKMSQPALIISLQAETQISLTTVAGQSSMDLVAEGLKTWS